MKALRFHGARDLRLEDVEEPRTAAGSVKVRVRWCGICGTDLHEYREGPVLVPTPERPHPLTGEHLPLVMGHELAGEVAEVGRDVAGFAVGQPVAVEPLLWCGRCPPCRSGAYNLCVRAGALGLAGRGGGFAEFLVAPAEMAHPLPEGMSLEAAAVAEPIAVGWHAVARARFRAGQTALVVGAGPIGLGTLASLRAAGAHVAVVSVRRGGARADAARALGADAVIDVSRDGDELLALTEDDAGYDAVFETSGTPDGLRTALRAARAGGTVVNVALWQSRAQVDLNKILARELSFVGSMAYAGEYPTVLKAIADGRLGDVTRMVTARVPLADAVPLGFEALADRTADHVKVLVHP